MQIYAAFIVVLIVLFIGAYARRWFGTVSRAIWHPRDSYTAWRARRLAAKSNGAWDAAAQGAYEGLRAVANPTTEERLARGNIVELNMIERDFGMDNAPAVNDVAFDYATVLDDYLARTAAADEFVLDHIEDFYAHAAPVNAGLPGVAALGAALNDTPALREEIIARRQEAAIAAAETPAQAAEQYLDAAVTYTDDRQNVHDTAVNNDMRRVYDRIRDGADRMGLSPRSAIKQFKQYVKSTYAKDPFKAHKANDALSVLDVVSRGNLFVKLNDNEDSIFANVWARCHNPVNRGAEDDMKMALADGLADAWDGGHEVCINGRVGRIIGSLATLDADDSVTNLKTAEMYKNQIFGEVHRVIQSEVDRMKDDQSDIGMAARSYEDPKIEAPAEAEEQFKGQLRSAIDSHIETYRDKLEPTVLEKIKTEAKAAVM